MYNNCLLQFDVTGLSCPNNKYLQKLQYIITLKKLYNSPAPVSMYCILSSLNCLIHLLLRWEQTYIQTCSLYIYVLIVDAVLTNDTGLKYMHTSTYYS